MSSFPSACLALACGMFCVFWAVWEFAVVMGVGGVVTARMIPVSVDLMVVVFLSIVVGLAVIGPALFAILVLLLPHVRSIAPRPPPLMSWTLI